MGEGVANNTMWIVGLALTLWTFVQAGILRFQGSRHKDLRDYVDAVAKNVEDKVPRKEYDGDIKSIKKTVDMILDHLLKGGK